MNPPDVRDRRYVRQWAAFYMTLGYTGPKSEILAEQLCSNCKRGDRITVDNGRVFGKSGKPRRRRIPQLVSLSDIARAISRSY